MAKAPRREQTINGLTIKALAKRAAAEGRQPYLTRDKRWAKGMAARVFPTGTIVFVHIYRRDKRPIWYPIGKWSADAATGADPAALASEIAKRGDVPLSLDEAITQHAIVYAATRVGKDPAAARMQKRGEGTFLEMYEGTDGQGGYLKQAKAKNKSWRQANRLVRSHLVPVWKSRKPNDISRADLRRLLDKFDDQPTMRNAVQAAASAFFSWLVEKELLLVNPATGIKGAETKSRERHLAHAEVPKFWAAFEAAGIAGLALRMVLITGQRPGEVRHMRTEHIGDDGWWEQPGEPVPELRWPGTKNGRTHRVFLPPAAHEILKAIGADGFVFGSVRGGPVASLDRTMRDICVSIEVPTAKPHDLRRSWATFAAELGFSTEIVDRAQNHVIGGINATYNKYGYAAEKKHLLETMAARIVGLASGKPHDANVVPFAKTL